MPRLIGCGGASRPGRGFAGQGGVQELLRGIRKSGNIVFAFIRYRWPLAKPEIERSQTCTLIYPFLAFLQLGISGVRKGGKKIGMTLHGCQLSYLQVQQAHHLSILASAEGLAGLPGTDTVGVVGLDSGSCIREGLCKESLIIITAAEVVFCCIFAA